MMPAAPLPKMLLLLPFLSLCSSWQLLRLLLLQPRQVSHHHVASSTAGPRRCAATPSVVSGTSSTQTRLGPSLHCSSPSFQHST
jgi:hypothetical protein